MHLNITVTLIGKSPTKVDMEGQIHSIVHNHPVFEFMVSTGAAERERWPFVSTLTLFPPRPDESPHQSLTADGTNRGRVSIPPTCLSSWRQIRHWGTVLLLRCRWPHLKTEMCLSSRCVVTFSLPRYQPEKKKRTNYLKVHFDYLFDKMITISDGGISRGGKSNYNQFSHTNNRQLWDCDSWWPRNISNTYFVVSILKLDIVAGVHKYYFSSDRFGKVHPKPQVVHNGLK